MAAVRGRVLLWEAGALESNQAPRPELLHKFNAVADDRLCKFWQRKVGIAEVEDQDAPVRGGAQPQKAPTDAREDGGVG